PLRRRPARPPRPSAARRALTRRPRGRARRGPLLYFAGAAVLTARHLGKDHRDARFEWPPFRRQGRGLLHGPGWHCSLHADGRSGRRGHQDRGAGRPSTMFETCNRGVKSVTLNLKEPEAREILYKLVARADIFGQNFRPGAAEKNGYGYEDLKKVNPKLVYVSISGYGPKGPHADLPGTDSMAQALGGIAEAYSTPGQPMKIGVVSVADETCAILAFGGMLAALHCARTQGVGQKVECSLLGG